MTEQEWGGTGASYGDQAAESGSARPRVRSLQTPSPRVSLPNFFSGGAGQPGITASFPSLPGRLGLFPQIARGKSHGPTAGTWYRVVYPEPMKNALPFVAALARSASIRSRSLARLQTLRRVEFPRLSGLGYTKEDYAAKAYNKALADAKGWMGDWGWANWIRDALVYPYAAVAWVGGWVANFLRDILLGRFIDAYNNQMRAVQDRINETLGALKSVRDDAQNAFEGTTANVNARLDDLLQAWGLPSGVALVSPPLRNVSESGFEWLSQGGVTVLWVAIADPRS